MKDCYISVGYYVKAAALAGALIALPGCVELSSPRVSDQTIDSKASQGASVDQQGDYSSQKSEQYNSGKERKDKARVEAAEKMMKCPPMGL